MAAITAQAVQDFRKATGLGLMECKALLKEADGDVKKATELAKAKQAQPWLYKTGNLVRAEPQYWRRYIKRCRRRSNPYLRYSPGGGIHEKRL